MSRRLRDPLPGEVLEAQRAAAHPESSIWVEANAGSGKTHVLTQRVLRLLLAGVRPEEVLCLTYTKAAAAEMRRRVSAQLANWALLPEPELRKALAALLGQTPGAAEQIRARTLFAHALDTPGGLRILTIHAFCESVLHRFPVEAGVPFDFTVIEEFERDTMILRAREGVIARGLGGGPCGDQVETLFGHLSDFALREAIEDALGRARTLRRLLHDPDAVKRRLRHMVGYEQPRPSAAIRAAIEHSDVLLAGDCRSLVSALGGNPLKGSRFVDFVARMNLDHASCQELLEAFLTEDGRGGPRASLMNAKERTQYPDLYARFAAEQKRVCELAEELKRAELIERSEAMFDVLAAILADYEASKRSRSLLDFDDLIGRTAQLFRDPSQGLWVRYKLDTGITHVLVDESQDTNEEQWAVVNLIADEFFVGASAVERPRTIFAVGDGKQSIFSFQGARPELFSASGDSFEQRAAAVGKLFRRVPLKTSFRTLPNILAAVDTVFAPDEKQSAVLARNRVEHATARADAGGVVTLWPPLQVKEEAPPAPPEQWETKPVDSSATAPRQVATRIAAEISRWVRERRPLGARGRPVQPEDVLVLVQTRAALFHELIRALIGAGLPTPGADRLMVTTHIAILDLMALGDVLLNPADDLQLAALLRSPLFGLSEAELEQLAVGREHSLWRALRDAPDGAAAEAAQRLRAWRSRLDFERPYEFFADVLYAEGGLKRFHSRFGSEVDDLFAEFLDLALEHEQNENPSLQGFLAGMRARDVSITRELSGATRGVRVMTVHGAKGLEAPIVILADAAGKPQGRQLCKAVIMDAEQGIFLHASSRKDHVPETAHLREHEEDAQWREYWRKLYVAMTRAEDELYVTGALTPSRAADSQQDGSWYQAIETTLRPGAEEQRDADGNLVALVYPRERPRPSSIRGVGNPAVSSDTSLELKPLPLHRRVETIRPSSAFQPADRDKVLGAAVESVGDPDLARREGIALHALLQHLTRISSEDRPRVALRALESLLPEAADRHQILADKATRILTRPDFAHLFGPESRAEVPFLVNSHRRGTPIQLAGRIDRLVVSSQSVLIVDFKSDAIAAPDAGSVKEAYLTQLGLYALLARELFPSHAVDAAILWTAPESLMIVPGARLRAAVEGFTMA